MYIRLGQAGPRCLGALGSTLTLGGGSWVSLDLAVDPYLKRQRIQALLARVTSCAWEDTRWRASSIYRETHHYSSVIMRRRKTSPERLRDKSRRQGYKPIFQERGGESFGFLPQNLNPSPHPPPRPFESIKLSCYFLPCRFCHLIQARNAAPTKLSKAMTQVI